jgi:hypothetical protein
MAKAADMSEIPQMLDSWGAPSEIALPWLAAGRHHRGQ